MATGNEDGHEKSTLERLDALNYHYAHGSTLDRAPDDFVLVDILRGQLAQRYPELPPHALDQAIDRIANPPGPDLIHRNRAFHVGHLARGFELTYDVDGPDGPARRTDHIHPIDFDRPEANHFLAVNQLPIAGALNDRRPDIVIFVNGLPLVLFELKSPFKLYTTAKDAWNQIRHYASQVPGLFAFNAFCVVSDGRDVRHGVHGAGFEWFTPWRSIDGETLAPNTVAAMKALVEGLLRKDRLLAYVRDFIVFEQDKGPIVKKAARYHQFFAVRAAVARTLAAYADDDRRVGVIWHTTGSGKSLSMVFLVSLLQRAPALENPTVVIEVDRTSLDDQLHDQFVRAKHLVSDVQQAASTRHLRTLLRAGAGGVVFTTIQQFGLRRGPDGKPIEARHPVLSERRNIIVIADEAHRSQYGDLEGFARYMREALPNARRLGFTGTPIELTRGDTRQTFGAYIHVYDIKQSQADESTRPIYYTARQAKLHLSDADIDAALAEAVEAATGDGPALEGDALERRKGRWAALAALAGTQKRVAQIAADLLAHFTDRCKELPGKAMAVCMTRANCVALYDALTALPGCPEVKVVMTGNLAKDPPAWSDAGHITTKRQREALKLRMEDIDDPLRIVIVCDMWLTGVDIPCLHTLYIDKPMRGHSMIQAISRVNRVFRDKPHGLVVDYIGIGEALREATDYYTRGGTDHGDPAPDIEGHGAALFLEALRAIRALMPEDDRDYGGWRGWSDMELEDVRTAVAAYFVDDDDLRADFLDAEHRVNRAYLLVKGLDGCRPYADEVLFYQWTRIDLCKVDVAATLDAGQKADGAVRDLVDDHVGAEGVVDIFELAGLGTPDISILDDDFLQTWKDHPHENLRVKLLRRLLDDALRRRAGAGSPRARGFRERLEAAIAEYHNRMLTAAQVVQEMIDIRKATEAEKAEALALGLSVEELRFFEVVQQAYPDVWDAKALRDVIHAVVATVRRNLKVDWTRAHRADVRAAVVSAVKRTLYKQGVQRAQLDAMAAIVMAQAEQRWANWPEAA